MICSDPLCLPEEKCIYVEERLGGLEDLTDELMVLPVHHLTLTAAIACAFAAVTHFRVELMIAGQSRPHIMPPTHSACADRVKG